MLAHLDYGSDHMTVNSVCLSSLLPVSAEKISAITLSLSLVSLVSPGAVDINTSLPHPVLVGSLFSVCQSWSKWSWWSRFVV